MIRSERVPAQVPLAISVAGQGPLVLLVHGMGGGRSAWHGQIDALARRYTAASVDLRGYGDSADAPLPLDFKRDFCADLLAVMDHFGVRRAHLVGLSMGGRVARATSLLAPERVASLTLANTSPGFDALTTAEIERFIADRSQALAGGGLPADFGLTQARQMVAPGTPHAVLQAAAQSMSGLRPDHYLRVLATSTRQDRGDRLEDIACPTLVITGGHDRVYPNSVSAQLIARLRRARHVHIEGAGHLSNLEQPQAFNRALLDFLDGLPPEAAARATQPA
jgi:3-oxoadipate enol-lactonase